MISQQQFRELIAGLTSQLAGRPLDAQLDAWLNREHGAGSETYRQLNDACVAAVAAGWMCNREAGGIRYGRVIKPDADVAGFSVDVVEMNDCAGPHHAHPNGEIDLLMPQDGSDARFDGRPAGWVVYGPGSAHHPTVSGGRALVLYLLPEGRIEFSKA